MKRSSSKKSARAAASKPRPTSARGAPARRVPPEQRVAILELKAAGFGVGAIAGEVTRKFRLQPAMAHKTVSRVLVEAASPGPAPVLPNAPALDDHGLDDLPIEDLLRRETVQLLVAGRRFASQGHASAYLRTMSTLPALTALGDRLASKRTSNGRPFDGLADLFTRSMQTDADRRRKHPGDWLADAGARLRVDLAEATDAVARLDAPASKVADLVRPLVVACESLLAAVEGQAAAARERAR